MKHLKYLQWNKNGSDTIVCIHGYADSAQMFRPLKSIFPNKCVMSVNLPMNNGEKRIYNVDELSDYVIDTIKEAHITNYGLIGFSLGGLVATDVASKDRNARKLVLLNSFPFLLIDTSAFRKFLHKTTKPLKTKLPLFLYSRIRTGKTMKWFITGGDISKRKKVYMKEKYFSVFGTMLNCMSYSGLYAYRRLKIPKKMVLFEDDRILPYKRFSRRADKHNLEITTIKSGGHNKTKDYWKNVGVTLKEFL